jgi:hypothetical protein
VWIRDVLARLAPGQEVEAAGWTNRSGFSPNNFPEAIRILGEKPEPKPRQIDRGRFNSGAEDCLRVTVQGLVQCIRDGCDDWLLVAADHDNRFTAALDSLVAS